MADREFTNINGIKVCDQTARNSIPTKTSQLENDSDYATITQVNQAIDNAQLGGGEVDLSGYVTKGVGNASQIQFADGQTFQAKLEAGTLKGDKGDKGDPGEQGPAGTQGQTPNITIGTVTTLDPNSNATAEIAGATPNLTLNLGIPKGEKGIPGDGGSGSTSLFRGKTANFLGDSITAYYGMYATKPYHAWVKELLGLSTVNNYGVSGTSIAKQTDNDSSAMCVRYTEMTDDADLIVVAGGINDLGFSRTLGETTSDDLKTFNGALKTLIEGLINKYPHKNIIFMTPAHIGSRFQNGTNFNEPNPIGLTTIDYSNAIKNMCAIYSIPVFDNNALCGINKINEEIYTNDSLHWNNLGHERVGKKLSKFIINNCILEDAEEKALPKIILSTSSITIAEGASATFTVNLDKQPSGNQTINISTNNVDVSVNPNTLTFTTDNYNTKQTVTINVAEDDSDYSNETCVITLSGTNISSKNITVNITDNDISQEPTNYTITYNLTNCTSSNSVTTISKNSNYTTTISPNEGYTLGNIAVVMGGQDISTSAVNSGVITIDAVTGNLSITCEASAATISEKIVTLSDFTINNNITGFTVNSDGDLSYTHSANFGLVLFNRNFTEVSLRCPDKSSGGRLIWYLYKNNGDDTYTGVSIGSSNGEAFAFNWSSGVTSTNAVKITNNPSPGDSIRIVNSGSSQTIYNSSGAIICTFPDADCCGFAVSVATDTNIVHNMKYK